VARVARWSERDDVLAALEAAYAAALQPERWTDALDRLGRLFGAVGATLEIFDKRSMALRDLRHAGLPAGAEAPYVDYYARHNPRAAYAMRHLSRRVLFDYCLIDEAGIDRDPYYVDYLASIGLRYFITAQVVDTPELHGVVSIQRSRRQGHVEACDVARMERLMPHLHQAYDLARRLENAGDARASLEAALDWLADGAAVLGRDGAVLHANRAMRDVAGAGDGIRIAKGGLQFADPRAARRLASALAAVERLRDGEPDAAGDFAAARPSGAPPYLVSVRPALAMKTPVVGDRRVPAAVVFVSDPLRAEAAAVRLLHEVYRLTVAEAGLARAMQAGLSPIEYARQRRLSPNTVYTHLRRLKEKTNSRRQAELIRRLNDAVAPLRAQA
jgi:DNA-binding CsgD family transcriptional regulator